MDQPIIDGNGKKVGTAYDCGDNVWNVQIREFIAISGRIRKVGKRYRIDGTDQTTANLNAAGLLILGK